jgi:hypothetical protein
VMKKKYAIDHKNQLLSTSLRKWEVPLELPSDFKSTVWRRISSNEASHSKGLELFLRMIYVLGNRQKFAISYLSVAVLLGVYLGFAQVKSDSEDFRALMGNRYVSLIDPSIHSNR